VHASSPPASVALDAVMHPERPVVRVHGHDAVGDDRVRRLVEPQVLDARCEERLPIRVRDARYGATTSTAASASYR
jgi:hypothetical protein